MSSKCINSNNDSRSTRKSNNSRPGHVSMSVHTKTSPYQSQCISLQLTPKNWCLCLSQMSAFLTILSCRSVLVLVLLHLCLWVFLQHGIIIISDNSDEEVVQRKSVYQILREWDSESNCSAVSLTDSNLTLPLLHSPVLVLASCSDISTDSSLIPNVSSATYSNDTS